MKNLSLVIVALFLSASMYSQSTPKPPKPPKTPKTPETTSTTKSRSFSFTFDTDDKEDNSTISIKRNDDIYKFTATFHESKTGAIKKMLVDKLGNSNLTVSGDTYRWIKEENGEKVYDCKLTDSKLKIYVDKEFANSKFISMMDEFGVALKDAISGTDSKEEERKIAESEFESAERELKRAKSEIERIRKSIKNN